METPVLSKKQIKSTLSAKKSRPKETVKHVLAIPYNNNYWPEICLEDQVKLQEVLKENLPILRNKSVKVPWSILKNISRAERKAYRMDYTKDMLGSQLKSTQNNGLCLGVGVNKVSKLLEDNLVQAILMAADVQPRLLLQHILDQAVLYKIPILCINDFREILRSITGIQSVCIAFHKNVPNNSKLNLIIEKIQDIFRHIPATENHINYNRSIESFKIPDELKEKKGTTQSKVKIDEAEIRKSLYLMRTDEKCRAFIPEIQKVSKMEINESEFLAFSDESKQEQTSEKSKNILRKEYQYKSLVVKRLRGDKNRNEKKIQNMKRKRE